MPARTVVRRTTMLQIDPQSKLAGILRSAGALPGDSANPAITVNSSHHQAAESVGDGLRLSAWCPADDVKEAVEGTADDHFVLCVQWHPERTYDTDPASRAMFQAFVRPPPSGTRSLPSKQQDFESLWPRVAEAA